MALSTILVNVSYIDNFGFCKTDNKIYNLVRNYQCEIFSWLYKNAFEVLLLRKY